MLWRLVSLELGFITSSRQRAPKNQNIPQDCTPNSLSCQPKVETVIVRWLVEIGFEMG